MPLSLSHLFFSRRYFNLKSGVRSPVFFRARKKIATYVENTFRISTFHVPTLYSEINEEISRASWVDFCERGNRLVEGNNRISHNVPGSMQMGACPRTQPGSPLPPPPPPDSTRVIYERCTFSNRSDSEMKSGSDGGLMRGSRKGVRRNRVAFETPAVPATACTGDVLAWEINLSVVAGNVGINKRSFVRKFRNNKPRAPDCAGRPSTLTLVGARARARVQQTTAN